MGSRLVGVEGEFSVGAAEGFGFLGVRGRVVGCVWGVGCVALPRVYGCGD